MDHYLFGTCSVSRAARRGRGEALVGLLGLAGWLMWVVRLVVYGITLMGQAPGAPARRRPSDQASAAPA
ncbi:hypothetical protein [Streptomyces sp. bgisy100]|uniref:hypothetical protein n=1 Tax=Streptomyces sp. bgisy100 TaxID=3413783 RepID=UPI003D752746